MEFEALEDSRHKMPAHFGTIIRVAGQSLSEEFFFVEKPPDEAEDGEDRGEKRPIGTKCQRHSNEIHHRTRVHGVTHDGIGASGNHLLALNDLDDRGTERICFEYSHYHPH